MIKASAVGKVSSASNGKNKLILINNDRILTFAFCFLANPG
jgi:hypothetical protein